MIGWLKRVFRPGEVDCPEVRRRSSDYLDGDLPPKKESAIKEHLSKCGPCRAFIETLSSTIGLLSGFPRVSPPPSFRQSLLDRVRREGDKPPR